MTLAYQELERRIASVGLTARGGFHPTPADMLGDLGGRPVRTVILAGFTGIRQWALFESSSEYCDGLADPLDRWSRRILDSLARQLEGRALYPFDGPPWWPFQRWARRALALHVSPLGVLIDPEYGLWHSYRGALALPTEVELPEPALWPNPCEACESKPCLHVCPVEAVREGSYDVDACRRYVRSSGTGCRSAGCLARRACPIGAQQAQMPVQAAFHMRAFATASPSTPPDTQKF